MCIANVLLQFFNKILVLVQLRYRNVKSVSFLITSTIVYDNRAIDNIHEFSDIDRIQIKQGNQIAS